MKRNRRLSPAFVIAVIALFFAVGGGAFALSKTSDTKSDKKIAKKISKKMVKKLAPKLSVLHADTADLALEATTADNASKADSATTAKNADNATTVNNKVAKCDASMKLFAGACWETAARAATTWSAAAAVCTSAGGSLPDTADLQAFALTSGVTLANTDEWASDINSVTSLNTFTVVTVSKTGGINLDAPTDSKQYRCVIPLVH
jgi:hypothetical protein